MYYVEDRNNVPMHVFIDQFSLVSYDQIGFLSAIGSRKALEDFRHKLTTPSYTEGQIHIRHCQQESSTVPYNIAPYTGFFGGSGTYRFSFRKLDNAPFWTMTVISRAVYNSCQDLVRGIKLTESMRKRDNSGQLWNNLPIYFLFRGSDLFGSDEAMLQFMQERDDVKQQKLLNNPYFVEILYKKLSSCSKIPFLREWMDALLQNPRYHFISFNIPNVRQIESVSRENKVFTFKIYFSEDHLLSAIRYCFREKLISINNSPTAGKISNISSLTQYLNEFSEPLVKKAHDRFNPLYTPGISRPSKKALEFFTNTRYFSDLNFYEAQQDVICSVAKGLARNKRTLIVGECGIGKTAIALASIYVHSQKKNPVTMVMCPGHMVEKWKEEILRLYPFARAHIIEKLSQLSKFEPMIRQKNAAAPLFLIFGKDSCKMEYDERPCLHWNDRKCHYEFEDKHYVSVKGSECCRNAERYADQLNFFLKPGSKNQHAAACFDLTKPYATIKNADLVWITTDNNHNKTRKLWTAASSNNGEWVKVAKIGWVNKLLAAALVQRVNRMAENGTEISKKVLKAYDIASVALSDEIAKPAIRCNISDYICRRMKNCIDYFIADEVHLYSSKDTAQGKAFSNMVNASRHTIALTGTLLNGYAENIFSMLFKLYSRVFVRNGFAYHDAREFAKEYGVVDTIREYNVSYNTYYPNGAYQQTKMTTKYKPGISPLLFSKFLLDKAVFVTLADITSDLPNYHEIPLGIEMDPDTKAGYTKFFTDFRNAIISHPDDKDQFLLKTIRRLNMYPDQPYNQVPVFNNETGEEILCPTSISRKKDQVFASNKDKKLLELIQKHKENREKVLVYVHWVNKLDCATRIQKLLEEQGIKFAFLTKSVSARARKQWIEDKVKEGIDVLICNPNLVKEGLDLLDFTTIIFYEMDDKLFTLRQASRRSLRLNQSHDITVYILYFKDTTQENIICLMANKLRAAMTIEGKFSEEGLNALGDTDSILTTLANNLTKDIDMKLEAGAFDFHTIQAETSGNRFKASNNTTLQDWIYKINYAAKKKPAIINVDQDLALLKTGS